MTNLNSLIFLLLIIFCTNIILVLVKSFVLNKSKCRIILFITNRGYLEILSSIKSNPTLGANLELNHTCSFQVHVRRNTLQTKLSWWSGNRLHKAVLVIRKYTTQSCLGDQEIFEMKSESTFEIKLYDLLIQASTSHSQYFRSLH